MRPGSGRHLLESVRTAGIDCHYPPGIENSHVRCRKAQDESSPFSRTHPRGRELHAHWATVMYRGLGCSPSSGIAFNRESPTPGRDVRDAQVSRAVARIQAGLGYLYLGDLDPSATGDMPRYVEGACGGCCRLTSRGTTYCTGTNFSVQGTT